MVARTVSRGGAFRFAAGWACALPWLRSDLHVPSFLLRFLLFWFRFLRPARAGLFILPHVSPPARRAGCGPFAARGGGWVSRLRCGGVRGLLPCLVVLFLVPSVCPFPPSSVLLAAAPPLVRGVRRGSSLLWFVVLPAGGVRLWRCLCFPLLPGGFGRGFG